MSEEKKTVDIESLSHEEFTEYLKNHTKELLKGFSQEQVKNYFNRAMSDLSKIETDSLIRKIKSNVQDS